MFLSRKAAVAATALGGLVVAAGMTPAASNAVVTAAPAGNRIVVSTTIQAAINAADPGDTVVVPPGVYHESVSISESGITLTGSRGAIIDATGFAAGITAVSNPAPPNAPCPAATLSKITIRGLTVRNASFTGVNIRGVDGFEVSGGRYLNTGAYGVFPRCAQNGVVSGNDVRGISDAGLYVGSDDHVVLTGNQITDSIAGVEVENSTNVDVTRNRVTDNAAGILVFLLPGRAMTLTDTVLVADNVVSHNNLQRTRETGPNPSPIDQVPSGTGIASLGADHVTITGNNVVGNDTGGIGVLANPIVLLDPRGLDPAPDFNRVAGNVVLRNGGSPDPLRPQTPGADLIYDGSGTGNCFGRNVFGTDFPAGITTAFGC
jgi:parallel beta-helix repeat protein